jgi:nucleotide-binding universal stress UspA family protein
VRHAEAIDARLVVMATHGRGGLERAWLGSVADDLVRRSPIPLLLLRPGADAATSAVRVRRILVPLDGSVLAETILEPALDLARLDPEAQLVLLTVIPPESPGFGPATRAWLDGVAHRIHATGVRVRTRVESGAPVARAILEVALQEETDLLALATHGRSGLLRLALGSVADHLLRRSHVPILLQRPAAAVADEAVDHAIELEAR